MQERELNDALSRMRLQLLKDGHFSQLSGQQRDLAISQGLGLPQQMPHSWGPSLQSASSSPYSWLPDVNGLSHLPGNQGTAGTQPMLPAGAGSTDGGASSADPQLGPADLHDQGNGLWGGGLYANDPHNIWSAGVSSSPQQGGSLTAPSVGAGLLLGQENGQQTQPLSHSQQLQLLAANGMGNMGNRVYSGNLGTDKYADNGQYSDYGGGLHGAGGLSPSNLGGLAALGNTYGGGKLQQGLPTNGLPNNGYGGNQPSQDYSGLHMNGGAAGGIHNGLGNAALAHKLAGLPNGGGAGYSNGHHLGNGSLAGLGPGSGMTGSNGHLSGLHPGGMAGGYGLQQQQQHQQQQQQQMLNEQLQALGPAGIAQLPPQLQAYARELLLRQHRAALMGAQQMQQPPPPPFGMPGAGGMLPGAQRLDMAGFRRDLQRNDMPLGRQGSRPLPPKGLDDSFLMGSSELLNGLPGQHVPPPPPPRAMNGRMQPPPPPPSSQAGTFQARVQQKKVIASLLQRGPCRDKAYVPGAQPKADMAQLNQELTELVDSLRPKPDECQRQSEALEALRVALTKRWPDCKVHLFGSTANQLSICNNNDIDVCLELPDLASDTNTKGEVVEELGQLLTEAGMQNVLPLPKARVPVVKFVVGDNGTKVDITVNNILAIVNTKLLADYVSIDDRLLQLCYVIKHWAKRRQVNDSYRGTLSSYCYVLMCIHLLQQRQPPILPCLQAIKPPTHFRTVGQWVCDYYDDLEALKGFGEGNKETLADLVWAFFEYWAWKHDYNNAVISVRTGGFLTKSQKEWTRRVGNERHLVCIEDPFELTHDLGRTVDRQTNGVLHKEFERAACVLRDHENPLEKLLEPYRAGKTE